MRRRVFFSTIHLALMTVREHKMRSFLTVLGVIIGSGTIIAVGSIIAGLDSSISGIFEGLGANSAMAFKVPPLSGNLTPEELNRKPLTYEDGVAIEERCPDVAQRESVVVSSRYVSGAGAEPGEIQRQRHVQHDPARHR